jgi:hypothetical protein
LSFELFTNWLGSFSALITTKQSRLYFAWRSARPAANENKLGSSRHYFSRGSLLCVWLWRHRIGSSSISLLQHLLVPLWALVRSWIGFSAAVAHTLHDHLIQFTFSAGGLRARRSFLQLIWLACVWIVWNERNHRLFSNAASLVHLLLDKIKMFSF